VCVPLLVRPAGGVPPRRVSEPASGVDVAPTLLALAGLEVEAGRFAGANLLEPLDAGRPVLVEDRDHLDPLDVRLALYDGRWKLVRQGIGADVSWALYDLEADPRALEDVARENREVHHELRAKLEGLRASWGADDLRDLEGLLGGGALNEAALRALGYLE
jgi:arylsulfatase A-like enzyme